MQPQAREKAENEGFEISIAKTSFKANTKALAENEGEGIAKVCFFFFLKRRKCPPNPPTWLIKLECFHVCTDDL